MSEPKFTPGSVEDEMYKALERLEELINSGKVDILPAQRRAVSTDDTSCFDIINLKAQMAAALAAARGEKEER
jgi:hypothetical protein